MKLYERIMNKSEKIAVVGLGYVGMPLAIAFAKKADVIGFDIAKDKVKCYLDGIDPTHEVGDKQVQNTTMKFTWDEEELSLAKFFVVAVPTPINSDKTPNLAPVISASEVVGRHITKGSIVVYESTVYPGVTEDLCVKELEKQSGLRCGTDFKIGYSPERINPGDQIHRLNNIKKIVSGMDEETLDEVAHMYELIVDAGVHKVSSIKVAEAAKVVENSQRDINIAFMNELAMVFDRMGIDTKEVVEAMNTKWNALGFYPGLVGGHCIGVDPYYFIYQAEKLGYHSQIIQSGRQINDSMGAFVADATIKKLVLSGKKAREAKVAVFGLTFKENCPDTRNSKVEDIILRLREYGIEPIVVDPVADQEDAMKHYQIQLQPMDTIEQLDAIIFAVAHDEFLPMTKHLDKLDSLYKPIENNEKVLIDVKSIFNNKDIEQLGYVYWRL